MDMDDLTEDQKQHLLKTIKQDRSPLRMVTKSLMPYLRYTTPMEWDATYPQAGRILLVPFKIPDVVVKVATSLAEKLELPGVTVDTIIADLGNCFIQKGLSDAVIESFPKEEVNEAFSTFEDLLKKVGE